MADARCKLIGSWPTDLADYLVRNGMPFRQAHHAVGSVVVLAERLGKPLNRLKLRDLQSVEKKLDAEALQVFDLKRALASRKLTGAPGTAEVRKQLVRWKRLLTRKSTAG